MSSLQFNKKRNTMKNELKHINTEKNRRRAKRVPVLTKTTGLLYGVERTMNKFVETIENNELLKEEEKENTIIDEPSPEFYGKFFELRKKIIFGHLMENEYLIGQFIGKTQKNMIESVNIRSSYFGEKTVDI